MLVCAYVHHVITGALELLLVTSNDDDDDDDDDDDGLNVQKWSRRLFGKTAVESIFLLADVYSRLHFGQKHLQQT